MASRIVARNLRRYLSTSGKPLRKDVHAAKNTCFKGTEAEASAESKAAHSGDSDGRSENAYAMAGLVAFNAALVSYIMSDY